MGDKTNQELADEGKKLIVRLYHLSQEMHSRACAMQCKKSVKATGRIVRNVSKLKDDALDLDGCMDDGAGGVSVESGGT